MTLREKIADWISKGELSAARRIAERWEGLVDKSQDQTHRLLDKYETACELADEQRAMLKRGVEGMTKYERALEAIIARGNTTSPNSTVKAMRQIAEKALGQ